MMWDDVELRELRIFLVLADEGSLVAVMDGVGKVFLLSSPHSQAVSWHRNAIDAARRTQVELLHGLKRIRTNERSQS